MAEIIQKKERQERDGKASGLRRQPGDETEPEWADLEEHHPQYLGFGGHMLRDYGCFLAVACQQHPAGQPSAHGPAVRQDRGGQHPYAGRPHDGHCCRSPDDRGSRRPGGNGGRPRGGAGGGGGAVRALHHRPVRSGRAAGPGHRRRAGGSGQRLFRAAEGNGQSDHRCLHPLSGQAGHHHGDPGEGERRNRPVPDGRL